jgi:hypothetical protein
MIYDICLNPPHASRLLCARWSLKSMQCLSPSATFFTCLKHQVGSFFCWGTHKKNRSQSQREWFEWWLTIIHDCCDTLICCGCVWFFRTSFYPRMWVLRYGSASTRNTGWSHRTAIRSSTVLPALLPTPQITKLHQFTTLVAIIFL